MSPQTIGILNEFASRPTAWHYGYELSRATGLKSGTLYPILMRLAKFGLLETKWVATENGVPPRHTYKLTPKGIEFVRESPAVVDARKKYAKRAVARTPVPSGSRA